MAYRNKTYVAFDGDEDMWAYAYMIGWKQSDNSEFNFYNAHDIKQARDSSSEETIKRSLRARMDSSKVFIILVGESTKNLYRYVRWEIELALSKGLPIIVVNLDKKRSINNEVCPPILRNELAIHISFNSKIIQFALENWGESHYSKIKDGASGSHQYNKSVYESLGL